MRHANSSHIEAPQPMSLAVYIARRSGSRPRRQVPYARTQKDRKAFARRVWELLSAEASSEPIRLAQLSLRRCLYLYGELASAERKQPEAALLLGRCIIETALTGSYLAIKEEEAAKQFSQKHSGAAQMLRDRFQQGDPFGALRLLGQVDFIAESLDNTQSGIGHFPRFFNLCKELDGHPPYSTHKLASIIYQEVYLIYSNHAEHPTIDSLTRHELNHRWMRPLGRVLTTRSLLGRLNLFRPPRLVPRSTLNISVAPAIGALCGTLARSLGIPFQDFDHWANEAAQVDGFMWSGSPARTLATDGLARLCNLNTARRLNCAGLIARAYAAMGIFDECSEDLQLLVCSQIFDDVKDFGKWVEHFPAYGILFGSNFKRERIIGQATKEINSGQAATHPQSLLAALTLVYANVWPDDPDHVSDILDRIDATGPIELDKLSNTFREGTHNTLNFREYRRSVWSRLKKQIETMP